MVADFFFGCVITHRLLMPFHGAKAVIIRQNRKTSRVAESADSGDTLRAGLLGLRKLGAGHAP